jgi:hypothetical protein
MDIRERKRGDRGKSLPERLAPTYSKNLSPIWGCYETRALGSCSMPSFARRIGKVQNRGESCFREQSLGNIRGRGHLCEANWTVMIYASRPELGDPSHLFIPARASLVGTFVSWVRADPRSGRHPNLNVQPVTTETDTPVIGFWEVRDLCQLPPEQCIPLLRFHTAANNRRITRPPLGPTVVHRAS